MASLYEDLDMIESAIDQVLYGEDEISLEALDNLFKAKMDTLSGGLERLCKIRANKLATIEAIKAEIARFRDRLAREERAVEGLENYIMDVFKRSGEKSVEAGTFRVGTRISNSVWVSPDFNDPEFIRTTTTTAVDKLALRDALKDGRTIDGAYMVTKTNLSIK